MHSHPGKASMSNLYLDRLRRKVAVVARVNEIHGLSALARLVFGTLLLRFHNTADGRCDPSATTVGGRLGWTERSVRSGIKELEAIGEVRVRQRRGSPEHTFAGLEKLYQDRKNSSGLMPQDRKISASRPEEIELQDRKVSSDKPKERTFKGNLEGGTTRIPNDWLPSPANFDFAVRFGLTKGQINDEGEKFRDYYLAAVGEKAVRADWSAD
jgi:hypothetical protein